MGPKSKLTGKKISVFIMIVVSCTFLGWCGGNIRGDYVRKTSIGFDVTSRIGYWIKGVSVGAQIGVIMAFLIVGRMGVHNK